MIMDGILVKNKLLEKLKVKYEKTNIGLAIIQIGENFSSNIYIKQKEKLAKELGVKFNLIKLDYVDTFELCNIINDLNNDNNIFGIIIQLPLPIGIDYNIVRNTIDPNKDIECVNDINISKLDYDYNSTFIPCTCLSILKLLEYYNIPLEGSDVTIIGRSLHIGKAMQKILLQKNSTVTLCHSKTKDISFYTKNSDIVISSIGKNNFITNEMLNKDCILIDVGFNHDNGKICGDVSSNVTNYKYITPVPGGIGPLTVYSLYENLYEAYLINNKKDINS